MKSAIQCLVIYSVKLPVLELIYCVLERIT